MLQQLNPYLTFNGDCEEAMKFYAHVLGGKVEAMMPHAGTPAEQHVPAEMRDKIMHARVSFGDRVLMASDALPGHYAKPNGISVSVAVAEPKEAERIFRSLTDGGTVTMAIGETFWALRFGMCTDRFGIPWMVNCDRPQH